VADAVVSKRQDRELERIYAQYGGKEKVDARLEQIKAEMERERKECRERHKPYRQRSGVLVIKGTEKPSLGAEYGRLKLGWISQSLQL
jgi:hypothetical protein